MQRKGGYGTYLKNISCIRIYEPWYVNSSTLIYHQIFLQNLQQKHLKGGFDYEIKLKQSSSGPNKTILPIIFLVEESIGTG